MFNRIGTVLLSLIPFNILILRRLVVVQKKSNQKKERERERKKEKENEEEEEEEKTEMGLINDLYT